jgi:citrate lyase subunit beta / citryl-CoA lyase
VTKKAIHRGENDLSKGALPPGAAWLFCPSDRPERFAKAGAVADVVILDLEDGVSELNRESARKNIASAADGLELSRVIVRVNPVGTPDHERDLRAISHLRIAGVLLAKTESREDIESIPNMAVIALCETARGVAASHEIASANNCVGMMWGAEDLVAGIGGSSSRDASGAYRDVARFARSTVLIAAASAGKAALDAVYLDLTDLRGLRSEANDAVASGFAAKVCLHPNQVPIVRAAFTSSDEAIAWAERVLEAAALSENHGAFALDGQMVDAPLIRQARMVLSRRPESAE